MQDRSDLRGIVGKLSTASVTRQHYVLTIPSESDDDNDTAWRPDPASYLLVAPVRFGTLGGVFYLAPLAEMSMSARASKLIKQHHALLRRPG